MSELVFVVPLSNWCPIEIHKLQRHVSHTFMASSRSKLGIFCLTCVNILGHWTTLHPHRLGHHGNFIYSSWSHVSEGMGGHATTQGNILDHRLLFTQWEPEVFCSTRTRLPRYTDVAGGCWEPQAIYGRRGWEKEKRGVYWFLRKVTLSKRISSEESEDWCIPMSSTVLCYYHIYSTVYQWVV